MSGHRHNQQIRRRRWVASNTYGCRFVRHQGKPKPAIPIGWVSASIAFSFSFQLWPFAAGWSRFAGTKRPYLPGLPAGVSGKPSGPYPVAGPDCRHSGGHGVSRHSGGRCGGVVPVGHAGLHRFLPAGRKASRYESGMSQNILSRSDVVWFGWLQCIQYFHDAFQISLVTERNADFPLAFVAA